MKGGLSTSEFFHSGDFSHLLVSMIVAILSFALWGAIQQVYKRTFHAMSYKGERTRDAMREIQNGLLEADIHIPYNQYDVHIVSQPDP